MISLGLKNHHFQSLILVVRPFTLGHADLIRVFTLSTSFILSGSLYLRSLATSDRVVTQGRGRRSRHYLGYGC